MPTPGRISFVVDENLLRLGRALAHLRPDIALVGEDRIADLLPKGILDSDWIPVVGSRGWVMITNDQRLRTRPVEAAAALEHNLKVIHLHGRIGSQAAWAQAARLFSRWEGIERHLSSGRPGPWWLSVRADSVRVLGYEPGRVERA
jgi:hypothetical protein